MNSTMKKKKARMNRYDVSPDIIEEILSYLPCKSLLQFKVVCKQWESLLHDSRFIDKHRNRSLNHPSHLLDFDYSSDDTKITLHMHEIDVDGYSHVKTVKTAVSNLYRAVLPSSYGLVCLHASSNRKLVIFNPNTEQVRNLQDSPEPFFSFQNSWLPDGSEIFTYLYFNNIGFGFDVKSKRYKVVQLVRDSRTHGISKCHVLTLERFEAHWRDITDASIDCKVEDLLFPICANGVIYWEIMRMIPSKIIHILTFDLRFEKIKMILAPVKCKDDRFDVGTHHLVELQGNLCFVDETCMIDGSVHMDIWMMNYSNDCQVGWAPAYKLELGLLCTCPYIFPMCMYGTRIIFGDNGVMYCYDVKEKCLKTYMGGGEDSARAVYLVHTEAIVLLD